MRVGKYSVKNKGELHDLLGYGLISEKTYEKYLPKLEDLENGKTDYESMYRETKEELDELKHRMRVLGFKVD